MNIENQEYLNSLPLKEASSHINSMLVNMYNAQKERKEELQVKKQELQQQYIETDKGDSSENQTLKNVVGNMKETNNQILANLKILQSMDLIEEREFIIQTYDFSLYKNAIYNLKKICEQCVPSREDILTTLAEILKLEDINDISGIDTDNVNEEEVQNKIEALAKSVDSDSELYDSLSIVFKRISEYLDILELPPYNSTGLILPYSTVRVEHEVLGRLTLRIYPDNISFMSIGVLSKNSPVAQRIMRHRVGDIVSIKDQTDAALKTIKIIDVY